MADRLPPLTALRAFEAAGRHLHFGKAADELFVTHSAISRQIAVLEAELKVSLFERRNRAVFLTEAGKRLLQTARLAFRQIGETVSELRLNIPNSLVVSCEPTLTQRWLIPHLAEFEAAHPDIVIHVKASGGPINLEAEQVDCAIRRSDFIWPPDVHAETLFDEEVGPVCAPSLLEQNADNDILALPRIHSATRPDAWDRWAADARRTLPLAGSRTFEHFYLAIEAAIAGLGAAIGPAPLVEEAIARGQLVAPLDFRPNGFRYVMLSRMPLEMDRRVQSLVNWLKEGREHCQSKCAG